MELVELTSENWVQCVQLWQENDVFIAPNLYSIAEAQFYPKAVSRALMYEGDMVGYMMYGEDKEDQSVLYIDRFMIAEAFRLKGLGTQALSLLLEWTWTQKKYDTVRTSTHPDNKAMRSLLESLGFSGTGEQDGDELVYELRL